MAIFLTTTATEIDEELLNRCLVLSVDESREQTRAIHQMQRERRTLAGLAARRERESGPAPHRNAQRLLRPLPVVNPYAQRLTFLDTRTRTRRDHEKYLTLIDTIALLHQHQRDDEARSADGASGRVPRGDARGRRDRQPPRRRGPRHARSTSCRRRPGALLGSCSTAW